MQEVKFNTDIGYDIYENIYYVADWGKDIVLNEVTNVINNKKKIYEVNKIEARIKTYNSLIEKMQYKGYELTIKNMIEKINDLIGIRIVCNNLNEVYDLVKEFKNDDKFRILKEKDYIINPKKSGYTSYHMIVEVPVRLTQKTINVKCEIQIRTLAMDFWASFEHKIKYKTDKEVSKKTSKELVTCAKMINRFDEKMTKVNNLQ